MRLDPDAPAVSVGVEGQASASWARRYRADLVWATIVVATVTVAFVVPHLHLAWLTPLVAQNPGQVRPLASTAPVLAVWLPHGNWATLCVTVLALAVIARGPSVARHLPWQLLVLVTGLTALTWTVLLMLIDGLRRGWPDRMNGHGGYLAEIPRNGSASSLIHGFASHIPTSGQAPWDISIAGDPPGALLTFFGLDRIGLGGPWWAGALCVLVGSSSAAAVLIALRALGDEGMGRRAAPFLAVAPLAVWVGVSADGYFAGVAAWGLALLTLSAAKATRHSGAVAVMAGILLGWSFYLDYGIALLVVPALAILFATRNFRPLIGAAVGAVVVAGVFTVQGFWWFDGLALVRRRYLAGIAMARPFAYWAWGNLAALTCAIGIPAAVGLRRAFDPSALRRRSGVQLLLVSFVAVIVIADVTQLSKAETERIWLPFAVWLVAAPALLPQRSHRLCLAVQAAGAILINSLLLTNW